MTRNSLMLRCGRRAWMFIEGFFV